MRRAARREAVVHRRRQRRAQRIVPVSPRFFTTLAGYLELERPETASTDRAFVVLKGQRRGLPLSAAGLDEIVAGARRRAGIEHLTCHQLRHTCFTRLREAGMALEAIQAQAGHRSIESTCIYLHLANDWLAGEYRRAVEAIDAQYKHSHQRNQLCARALLNGGGRARCRARIRSIAKDRHGRDDGAVIRSRY